MRDFSYPKCPLNAAPYFLSIFIKNVIFNKIFIDDKAGIWYNIQKYNSIYKKK